MYKVILKLIIDVINKISVINNIHIVFILCKLFIIFKK